MVLGGDIGHVPTDVTLDNWQSASHLHWTFQHVADFLPTAVISRGVGHTVGTRLPPNCPNASHATWPGRRRLGACVPEDLNLVLEQIFGCRGVR